VHHVRDGPLTGERGRSRNAITSCPWVTNARTFVACALQDAADGLDVVGGDYAPLTHAVQVQLKTPCTHSRITSETDSSWRSLHSHASHMCHSVHRVPPLLLSDHGVVHSTRFAPSHLPWGVLAHVCCILTSLANCHQIFRCDIDCAKDPNNCISETLYKQQADAMVAQDFVKFGYDAIHMDDCVSWP
jgi:hypothetical protein